MRYLKPCATTMLAATLVAGALYGCGAPSGSASASASGETASAATEATSVDTSELTAAMAGAKDYQSVTVENKEYPGGEGGTPIVSLAKYDLSGGHVTSSVTYEVEGMTFHMYYDGQDMVADYGDGDVFKLTADEIDDDEGALGVEQLVPGLLGNFDKLVSCAASVEKQTVEDGVSYELVVDPALLAKEDEMIKEFGGEMSDFSVRYSFGADGRLTNIESHEESNFGVVDRQISFLNYDSTVVDPAPETDRTLADHEAALEEAWAAESEESTDAETEEAADTASAEAAEATE